jgi:hypothetical protein
MTSSDNNNLIIDSAIAAGAMTLPWWAEVMGAWAAFFVTLGSLGLLVFRIMLAYREWKRG